MRSPIPAVVPPSSSEGEGAGRPSQLSWQVRRSQEMFLQALRPVARSESPKTDRPRLDASADPFPPNSRLDSVELISDAQHARNGSMQRP
jgi:hypothetical protein